METKTIIETKEQVITDNAVYDITTSKTNGVVTTITANVTAQIWQDDEGGGHILSAKVGTIEQNDKGTSITGEIPSDVLPSVISEFNEIVDNFNNN